MEVPELMLNNGGSWSDRVISVSFAGQAASIASLVLQCPAASTCQKPFVVAATVKIQGATLTTDSGAGPLFPAAKMPFCTAWKAPMAIGFLENSSSAPVG